MRKFTRKPKPGSIKPVEQVIEPQQYVAPSARDQYAQAFLFWQSWQDELINALMYKSSQKKQRASANESLKNLGKMRALLPQDQQKKLDTYISDMDDIKSGIERNTYGRNSDVNARAAERLKRAVLREFSLRKVTNDLGSTEPGAAGN